MEMMVKKFQSKFNKVREEMNQWDELQSRLISQFRNASHIVDRLQVLQKSSNYGILNCVGGVSDVLLQKQIDSLNTISFSMRKTLEEFHCIVLSLEKMHRDGRQLVKGSSSRPTMKQLQQRVGVKPTLIDCLDGLSFLHEIYYSEYLLKTSIVSALSSMALIPSNASDLGALQQLLVDQPNILTEEGMERRNTRKFTFRKLDLENLKKLAFEVTSLENFCDRHGKLLGVLWTNIEKGCLETLVQFYDPAYHCFTFPDYQLMPTLEEYSHLIGLPVLDKVPFTGLEPFPKAATIANALHLKTSLIKEKLTLKGNLPSLPTKFLYQQASEFSKTNNVEAFYSILALLIYGLVLFPNIDNYVDIHAIQIFLTKNPVPTLLADIYHSIHDRTQVGRGAILGCAPLLYKWFTSHLPQTHSFQANPENLSWPKRIMSLTPSDITWYRATCNFTNIIVSCGEYSNVPLLGTQGGISYNPILAKRQFGCPMEAKPDNIYLQGEFYFNHEDPSNKRGRFVQAWHAIRTLNRSQLARRSDSLQGSYTQWVINRASDLVLPYHLPRYLSSTTPAPALPLAPATVEECQEKLARSECVGATWKRKYDEAMLKMETMSGEIEQREHEVHKLRRQIVKKNVQIRAQSTRLSQFISAGERWEFFKDAHSDSDE